MNRKQAGFGLMEVLFAAGIGSVVVGALVMVMQRMSQFNQKVESSTDLTGIRARLAESVNCTRTFQGPPVRPLGNPCPAGQYINLLGSGGQMVVPAAGLVVGQWTVRAYCNNGDGSLDVRAAKIRPGAPAAAGDWRTGTVNSANFLRDTMGGNAVVNGTNAVSYSWDHPKSRLFPTGGGGLCSNWFAGTPGGQCSGPNEYVKSIDFNTNLATCRTIPACGGELALQWNGSDFTCTANARSDASISALATNAANAVVAAKTAITVRQVTMTPTGTSCAGIGANFGYIGVANCPAGTRVIDGDISCLAFWGGFPTVQHKIGNGFGGICCSINNGGIGNPFGNTARAYCIPN